MGQQIFTTGEVARLLHVSPRTVSVWIDGGIIQGGRLPGSNHRRIYRAALEEFLNAYDHFPTLDELEKTRLSAAK